MTKEEAIKYLQQLYPNGGHCWLDEQRIKAIGMAVKALQEEPISDKTMTIRKEWFEHCKKSWYNEGYIDCKYNRKSQFKEPVSDVWHNASEKPERENLLIETNDGRIIHRQSINNYGMVKRWAYISVLLNLDNSCNFGKNLQEELVPEEVDEDESK